MLELTKAIEKGHYARKQLSGRAWLMVWSHRQRFALAQCLVARYRGRRVLDYGCGDGTFLALACASADSPAEAVGAEITPALVEDCQTRFGCHQGLSFVTVGALSLEPVRFDAIVCMEVLEHVIDWEPVFALWDRLLLPGGEILVSVPVETGPALAVKQFARWAAGCFGIGDYPGMDPYTWSEYLRGLFAGRRPHMIRPVHRSADGSTFHCHKGFNWRVLRSELSRRWELLRMFRSPIALLPASCNSQVWFLLRKS